MKKLLVAPVIVATLGVSSFALAGGPDDMGQSAATHNSQVIVGVDGGYAWGRAMQTQSWDQGALLGQGVYTKNSAKEGNFTIGGHVAYLYTVMPKLAVGAQLGYLHLGQTNVKATETLGPVSDSYNFKVNQQLIDLLATVQYDVYNGLNVFAQAGPAFVMQADNFDSTVAGASQKKNINKVEPMIGAGVSYDYNNIVVSVAYDHLFGNKPSTTDVTQNANATSKFSKDTYSANVVLGSVGYALPL